MNDLVINLLIRLQRENWNNPLEFLMSCIAMSVGLGNYSANDSTFQLLAIN